MRRQLLMWYWQACAACGQLYRPLSRLADCLAEGSYAASFCRDCAARLHAAQRQAERLRLVRAAVARGAYSEWAPGIPSDRNDQILAGWHRQVAHVFEAAYALLASGGTTESERDA